MVEIEITLLDILFYVGTIYPYQVTSKRFLCATKFKFTLWSDILHLHNSVKVYIIQQKGESLKCTGGGYMQQ